MWGSLVRMLFGYVRMPLLFPPLSICRFDCGGIFPPLPNPSKLWASKFVERIYSNKPLRRPMDLSRTLTLLRYSICLLLDYLTPSETTKCFPGQTAHCYKMFWGFYVITCYPKKRSYKMVAQPKPYKPTHTLKKAFLLQNAVPEYTFGTLFYF